MQLKTLLTLLPALAAVPINAYFILSHSVLETTRMDPIISPGGVSQHVHSIVGGSNFDDTMTYQSALASGCTTAPVSVDKSNYWTPQLYYYGPDDQSFQLIPVNYVNTYYLPRGPNNSYNVSAFPDGLRMVAGNPYRRTYNASSFADQAVSFVCLDYNTDHSGDPDWAQRNNFFDHNCPSGMRMQVNFPSCWDGVNLDSADHTSHMAYASGGPNGGGDCPSTHPVHLVTLFYEFIYNVQNFPFNNASYPTWVLANGDTTGYGFHGDFVNGWPAHVNGTNVLQQALDQCNDNNGVGGELNNCPPFVPYLNNAAASACKPQNDQIDEDIGLGHKISKLPGDNPLWIGNSTTKPTTANYTEPNTTYTNFESVIPTGYNYVGCIAEGTSGRALTGKSISNANMTRGACVSFCQSFGFPLAGVEYGQECYCGMQMVNGASNTTFVDATKCNMNCANNTNENCGGSSVLNLWNNPSLYPSITYPTGWSSYGCMTEATSGRALSKYSFSTSSMTPQLCMTTCQSKGYSLAGTEYSQECYCANSFSAGSVSAADSSCSMACAGNKAFMCGGSSRLSVYSYTNVTAAASSSSSSSSAPASSSSAPASSSSSSAVATAAAVSSSSSSSAAAAAAVASSTAVVGPASSVAVTNGTAPARRFSKNFVRHYRA